MALSKTVTAVVRDGDAVTVRFSDGSSIGLGSIDDIRDLSRRLEHEDGWLQLWAAYWLARDADLSSATIPVGTFTLDAGAANLFRKQ